jgi:hypothetical protein
MEIYSSNPNITTKQIFLNNKTVRTILEIDDGWFICGTSC